MSEFYKLGAEDAVRAFGVHSTPKPPPTWSQAVQRTPRKTVNLKVTLPSMREGPAR